MAPFLTALALAFGLALIATGGWLTFIRRPLVGILCIVFGAFVTLASLTTPTSVTTSGQPQVDVNDGLVSTTPGAD